MTLLDTLNDEQREAVTTTDGPLLVFAGAGSGKTRVLTHRIAHILEQGLATPDEMLVVTFTNKAAGEVRDRVASLVGPRRFPYLGTFHGCCLRMLRTEHDAIGLKPNFTIYDTTDSTTVIKEAAKELNLSDDKFDPKRARTIISNAKNNLVDADTFARKEANTDELETVAKIFKIYERVLRENAALDFDDLLVLAVRMLTDHPALLQKYQERFRYILVDEYQDVNFAQYVLIKKLAGKHRNICVVGDDDQSIYGFRGAKVELILQFKDDFGAKVVKLEQNYRSTKAVLDVANAVVANNPKRANKTMRTDKTEGPLPRLFEADEGRDEATFVVRTVRDLMRKESYTYSDFAVLYRTNAQSRAIEDALKLAGMPYQIIGGQRFWDRKEIRDLVAYLRVLANPDDEVSLRRIINVPPRSLGTVTLGKLVALAERRQITLYETLKVAEEAGDIGAKAVAAISELTKMFETLRARTEQLKVTEVIDRIIRTVDYKAFIAPDRTPESTSRLENIEELVNTAAQFERDANANGDPSDLVTFLSQVSLSSDLDDLDESGAISLMTLHSAKGLEYPVVFLVGLEDGYLPHARVFDHPDEVEEERRLAYVGLTRAEKHLFLSLARQRDVYGQRQSRVRSRFLEEIPEHLVTVVETPAPVYDEAPARRSPYSEPSWSSGSSFGSGTSWGGGSSWESGSSRDTSTRPPAKTPSRGTGASRATGASRGGSSTSRSSSVRTIRPGRSQPIERIYAAVPEERTVHVNKFAVGDKVVHKVFGEGTALRVEGKTVTAEFPGYGEKTVTESFLSSPRG